MSTLTVGAGQQFATIAAAVAASRVGDVVAVYPGTYTNDWITVSHSLTIQGVPDANGTLPVLKATAVPPNGMGLIDQQGGALIVRNLEMTGAHLNNGGGGASNAAAVRFERGSSLTLDHDYIHNNDDGILANPVSSATITISNSEIAYNGTGDGYTHNVYIGKVNNFVLQNSFIHDANGGHEVKTRAAHSTLTGNVIADAGSKANYSVDLPNGGAGLIQDNVIEQGARSGNNAIISYGEEGNLWTNSSLTVSGNTLLNDLTAHLPVAVRNWDSAVGALLSNNSVYGITSTQMLSGAGSVSGTITLSNEPDAVQLGRQLMGN